MVEKERQGEVSFGRVASRSSSSTYFPALARMFQGVMHHPPMTTAKIDPRRMFMYRGKSCVRRKGRTSSQAGISRAGRRRRERTNREHVVGSTDGVGRHVGSDRSQRESQGTEESSSSSLRVVVELVDKSGRVPQELSVDFLSSRSNDDSNKGGQGEDDGDDESLDVDGSSVLGVSREIRDLRGKKARGKGSRFSRCSNSRARSRERMKDSR